MGSHWLSFKAYPTEKIELINSKDVSIERSINMIKNLMQDFFFSRVMSISEKKTSLNIL